MTLQFIHLSIVFYVAILCVKFSLSFKFLPKITFNTLSLNHGTSLTSQVVNRTIDIRRIYVLFRIRRPLSKITVGRAKHIMGPNLSFSW